jgi:hypothetical protein
MPQPIVRRIEEKVVKKLKLQAGAWRFDGGGIWVKEVLLAMLNFAKDMDYEGGP